MTVTLVQMDIAWGDAKTNREAAEKAILSAEKSDLYVLPEMWNTGFDIEPEGIAECLFPQEDGEKENKGSETLLWMQRMADKLDAAVAGSIAVRLPDGSYRNRLYFVTPGTTPNLPPRKEAFRCQSPSLLGGEAEGGGWYDKHHLFTYGNEHLHYTPGNERVTVEWRGVRFRLSTCYDLRFPLWLRYRGDYDALICVASWPSVRMLAWRVLLQARAIENQCYVLGVNRVGSDPACQYSGGTAFVNPYGEMTACPEGEAAVLTQTIDMEHLRTFRRKFPVLKEAD